MSNVTIERISVDKVLYQGKTYTCNGERIMIGGQVRWLYRTRDGLDCDILVCDDRYLEEPEFTHLIKFPSGCYTVPSSGTTPKCLTFTADEDGVGVGFVALNIGYELPKEYEPPRIEYSLDDGETWQPYEVVVTDDVLKANAIWLDTGNSVLFRGDNDTLAYYIEDVGDYVYFRAYISGSVAASGDVTSLLNGVGGDADVPDYCYSGMFSNCTSLTTAPELPATTLADGCYYNMFNGCIGLTEAPELPATTLEVGCYEDMFNDCTGLTEAPVLPATTLADGCYTCMFSNCTSLTTAPELPATILAEGCYNGMFSNCTSLTTAPELPATILAEGCYSDMFSECTGLTEAPELPATTLAEYCYGGMFRACTGLTESPTLPATTLVDGCYSYMFDGCNSINKVTCLATDISANACTEQWLSSAPKTGVFTKASSMSDWSTGISGIPSGWTVVDA